MISPFTGFPIEEKQLTDDDKTALLDDDKWVFNLASKLNIPGAAGGGAPFDLADHTTDELPEGSTNLYSQWEMNTYGAYDYLQSKDTTNGLVVGEDIHSSVSTSFNGITAVFNDSLSPGQGINYFGNLSYGVSGLPLGGIFLGARTRGTADSPTATQNGDFLGGAIWTGFGTSAWQTGTSGGTHLLPGLWASATSTGTTTIDQKLHIGGLLTPMLSWNSNGNAILFNEAQLDSDITFYYDTGTTLVMDGGTGNITAGHLSGTTANSLANIDTAQTFTNKRITPRVGTTTSSATPTINTDNYDVYGLTAQTADITSFTTNLSGTPTNGQKLWIYIVGTAARAITWGSSFENGASTLPTTTVGTERLDVGFIWNAVSSKWRCMAAGSA